MSGGGIAHSIKMALTITGYLKSTANQSSLTIASGSSGTSTISVQSFGLKGTVILTISVSSAGITPTLNPTSISYSPGRIHTSTLSIDAKTRNLHGNRDRDRGNNIQFCQPNSQRALASARLLQDTTVDKASQCGTDDGSYPVDVPVARE